jgi:hypothetical protein
MANLEVASSQYRNGVDRSRQQPPPSAAISKIDQFTQKSHSQVDRSSATFREGAGLGNSQASCGRSDAEATGRYNLEQSPRMG